MWSHLASGSPGAPEQPGSNQDRWVTTRGKPRHRKPVLNHQTLSVSNRFSPLSDSPAENVTHVGPVSHSVAVKPTLVIGSSVLRNVKVESPACVKCIPGARAGDVEANLKLLDKRKVKYSKIVIHVGANDTRLRQSELTKVNMASVCTFAKTMSDTVVFSGPLPNVASDNMYSRMSSLHRWMSRWCLDNNVAYIDNWTSFWGKPGLIRRDGVHPTLDGASLLSRNIGHFISHANH